MVGPRFTWRRVGLLVLLVCGLAWQGSRDGHNAAPNHPDAPELASATADSGRSTNILAVGDWSPPVTDAAGYTLRGRLLVFDTPHFTNDFPKRPQAEWWGNAPVYLELENLSAGSNKPVGIYSALGDGFEGDMRDVNGNPAAVPKFFSINGSLIAYGIQSWTMVPSDGSVRLRVDPPLGGFSPKPVGVRIQLGLGRFWLIPPGEANAHYLSGTFRPPSNHPPPPDYHVWQGILKLPAVKIVAPKP